DGAGRILSRREVVDGEAHTDDYTYDTACRLTDVAIDGSPSAHYDYDDNGNRLARNDEACTYDAQDRLLSAGTKLYSYTPDGALDSKVDTATGATTFYRYDMGGHLLGATLPSGDEIGYVVDARGRRVGRTLNGQLTHGWLYGSNAGPAAELDASGEVVSR